MEVGLVLEVRGEATVLAILGLLRKIKAPWRQVELLRRLGDRLNDGLSIHSHHFRHRVEVEGARHCLTAPVNEFQQIIVIYDTVE